MRIGIQVSKMPIIGLAAQLGIRMRGCGEGEEGIWRESEYILHWGCALSAARTWHHSERALTYSAIIKFQVMRPDNQSIAGSPYPAEVRAHNLPTSPFTLVCHFHEQHCIGNAHAMVLHLISKFLITKSVFLIQNDEITVAHGLPSWESAPCGPFAGGEGGEGYSSF